MIHFHNEAYSEKEVSLMNVLQTAYVGDAVWELIVRNRLIRKGLNVHHMHSESIQLVNAGAQAAFIRSLMPELSETEVNLVKRGRNAHARHPAPKNQHPDDYSMATAFEVFIGFLYLTGQEERLNMIAERILGGNDHG